eukprot:4703877-Prymnesium_polylepis.1
MWYAPSLPCSLCSVGVSRAKPGGGAERRDGGTLMAPDGNARRERDRRCYQSVNDGPREGPDGSALGWRRATALMYLRTRVLQ